MNKKILIASLFATLMLTLPMTSVVGVSDVSLNRKVEKIEDNDTITETYDDEDCGCEVVSKSNLVRVKLLLVRIEVITNILLLRFGHIPEVQEKCQEILDIINSNRQLDFSIICDILEPIYNQLDLIMEILYDLYWEYKNNPIINKIISALSISFAYIWYIVGILGAFFNCEGIPWP